MRTAETEHSASCGACPGLVDKWVVALGQGQVECGERDPLPGRGPGAGRRLAQPLR